jgi:phytoene/squalene synthetase
MELTSILRTVGNALERNRIYLPLDEIEAFGYSKPSCAGIRATPRSAP